MANPTRQTAEALTQVEQTALGPPLDLGKWMTLFRLLQTDEGIVQGLLASNPAMATGVGVCEGRGERNEGAD